VQVVITPNVREAYEMAWGRIDERGCATRRAVRATPHGFVEDVLAVVGVWDSEDDMKEWMQRLGPILELRHGVGWSAGSR
jgi:hypothetical protein